MAKVKNPYPLCERDGFPMIKIDGQLQCVAEYLDRCIGQQKVVDLIHRGKTDYYVFENGHELPLLCCCCGTPLVTKDPDKARRDIRGRRLEKMSIGLRELDDVEVMEFHLEFSKKGVLSREVYTAVAPEAARQMRHPSDCIYKRDTSSQGSRKKKRRRRR